MISKITSDAQLEIVRIKKLIKEMEAYMACHDWINAKFVASVISNRVKYLALREQERILDKRV